MSAAHDEREVELGVALLDACKLLELARCPDTNCTDGCVAPDGHQCQWCDEKNKLVAEHG